MEAWTERQINAISSKQTKNTDGGKTTFAADAPVGNWGVVGP